MNSILSSLLTMSDSDSDEDMLIICCLLMQQEENERKRKKRKRSRVQNICKKRRLYGEYHTSFRDLVEDDVKFFQYFHMTHEKFTSLLEILKVDLMRKNTSFGMPVGPQERLSLCLRYLATGNSFRTLASSYGLEERTVREIVYSTCDAIWKKLQPLYMPKPDEELWIKIEQEFSSKWNFPNLIGTMYSKHILIQAPSQSGSQFFCTVLLALIDANDKFIVIDVGACEKNCDGSVNNSNLGKALQNNTLHIPAPKQLSGSNELLPHVVIGNEASPLCTYLMKPYSLDKAQENEEIKVFNDRLNRALNVTANAFGMLVKKFRIFEQQLSISPEHTHSVILAACCLHNFLRNDTCHWTESDLNVSISDMRGLQNLEQVGENPSLDALEVRDKFKNYFNSDLASIE